MTDHELGIVLDPQETERIEAAILQVLGRSYEVVTRKNVEVYSRRTQAAQLAGVLDSLVVKPDPGVA